MHVASRTSTAGIGNVFEGGGYMAPKAKAMGYFGDLGTMRIRDTRMEGFGYLGQNAVDTADAAIRAAAADTLSYYQQLKAIIPTLTPEYAKAAQDIINKKYLPSNFFDKILGTGGRWNLDELAAMMQDYINTGFIQIDPKTLQVTTTRRDRLTAFQDAVKQLGDAIPVKPSMVGTSPALFTQLQAAAAKARTTQNANDAIGASELASVTSQAASTEGRSDLAAQANAIKGEMDAIAAKGNRGFVAAPEDIPWMTIGLVGGGLVVVLGLAYYLTKK